MKKELAIGLSVNERRELLKLAEYREQLAKANLETRGAVIMADFETKLAAKYKPEDDEVWDRAYREAEKIIAEANVRIMERAREMGIPPEFAPRTSMHWHSRYENSIASRRQELRNVARAKVALLKKAGLAEILRAFLEIRTEILGEGFLSDRAQDVFRRMPTPDALMPLMDVDSLEHLSVDRKGRLLERSKRDNYD
jgi:hypothetical protein